MRLGFRALGSRRGGIPAHRLLGISAVSGWPSAIIRPELAAIRPGIRFGLIDYALAPFENALPGADRSALDQLKRDLAVVVGAEALFTLTDLCGLSRDDAVANAARTAATVTSAAHWSASWTPHVRPHDLEGGTNRRRAGTSRRGQADPGRYHGLAFSSWPGPEQTGNSDLRPITSIRTRSPSTR